MFLICYSPCLTLFAVFQLSWTTRKKFPHIAQDFDIHHLWDRAGEMYCHLWERIELVCMMDTRVLLAPLTLIVPKFFPILLELCLSDASFEIEEKSTLIFPSFSLCKASKDKFISRSWSRGVNDRNPNFNHRVDATKKLSDHRSPLPISIG